MKPKSQTISLAEDSCAVIEQIMSAHGRTRHQVCKVFLEYAVRQLSTQPDTVTALFVKADKRKAKATADAVRASLQPVVGDCNE